MNKGIMRITFAVALLIMASQIQAQSVDSIAIHDSLAVAVPSVNNAEARKTDSVRLSSTVRPQYPAGRAIGTFALATLTKAGAACLGGLAGFCTGLAFSTPHHEYDFDEPTRCAVVGGLLCDIPTAAVTIHRMNKKYVSSSPWFAAGGVCAHYAVAAVLVYLLRDDRTTQTAVASTAYLTAPISGIAAYFIFGKPKRMHPSRSASRP